MSNQCGIIAESQCLKYPAVKNSRTAMPVGKKMYLLPQTTILAIVLVLAKAYMFLAWCLLYGPNIKPWCGYE